MEKQMRIKGAGVTTTFVKFMNKEGVEEEITVNFVNGVAIVNESVAKILLARPGRIYKVESGEEPSFAQLAKVITLETLDYFYRNLIDRKENLIKAKKWLQTKLSEIDPLVLRFQKEYAKERENGKDITVSEDKIVGDDDEEFVEIGGEKVVIKGLSKAQIEDLKKGKFKNINVDGDINKKKKDKKKRREE